MGKKDGIAAGKKRVMVTLTEAHVTKLQRIFREGGLPPGTLSTAVDDFIKGLIKVIEGLKGKETFTVADYFQLAGEQLELLQEREEPKNAIEQTSKTEGVAKRGRPRKENDPFKQGRYPIGKAKRK